MFDNITVGVLALQGDFERHLYHLKRLNVTGREVRKTEELNGLDGLIIPGGESTTFSELIDRFSLRRDLIKFCTKKAVWGTCAGMIMLARQVDDDRVKTLNIIDIKVERNGYGRQIYSAFAEVNVRLNGSIEKLPVSFIRAPIVVDYGEDVEVLAEYENRPILLARKNCLVSSFHTELHENQNLLKYFLDNFVLKF
jgi:pyridoxal 5'-phosphate synthase pdxT subunit